MSLTSIARPIHRRLRQDKVRRLLTVLRPTRSDTLLDVGGGLGIVREFADLYWYFRRVVVLNLEPVSISASPSLIVDQVVGDGCVLPFATGGCDWVFCNAVIEHVGPWERQQRLADEIRRVARKGYFVATPNRSFPIEPHTLFPFYQFFPPALQARVVPLTPGYLRRYEPIHLLDYRHLRTLFPEAVVEKMGFPPIPNNLVAYHKKDQGL